MEDKPMLKRMTLTACLLLGCMFAGAASAAIDGTQKGLPLLAVAPANPDGSVDGIATFGGAMPASSRLDGLRGLGLRVQGFQNLPLALMRGPRSAMFEAVSRGLASDVYPNERLQLDSYASDLAIRANEVQTLGIDGAGVGVAVVDSGIDATHPDLRNRVTHNVKIVDGSVVGVSTAPLVIPVDQGPYNNSDTSSGHGTHVAGIVAADNTDGQVLGVAPGADLIGYGTGDVVFIFSILSAYDDMITHRADWRIRVANNSWGSSFRLFDPDEPVNQATKAAHDAGIVVVFSAGNSTTEMAINPYSVAPWVISVGAGTLNHQRASFSSGGIEFDNSTFGPLPAGDEKHLSFTGDRIGLYHPSVSAPGVDIVSTATAGVLVTSLPGGTSPASGTSMSCPHVSGVVALMLQKRPSLTPDEVKSALQVTATLMPDTSDTTHVQPFWQVGYGYLDAKAAVDLVGRQRFNKEKTLARLQQTADRRVLGDRDYSVLGTDYWTFLAAAATVSGVPDDRTFSLQVTSATKAIKAIVSYPSLGYVGLNPFDYHLTLVDAAGQIVAESTASSSAGMSQFFVDLTQGNYAYGTWTINVRGDLGAQDQDTVMGVRVAVAVSQLAPQSRLSPPLPVFTPTGSVTYFYQPGQAGLTTSPEGCNLQAGAPVGGLATAKGAGVCQSGSMGYTVNYGAGVPADFTSAPLAAPLTVGGTLSLKFYLTDPAQPVWQSTSNPRLGVEIDVIDANGDLLLAVASGEWTLCSTVGGATVCTSGPQPVAGTYTMQIPAITLPAGSRISVLLRETAAVTSASRTVYGGQGLTTSFADAGVTFTTGTLQ
jgi:serine protease AprX